LEWTWDSEVMIRTSQGSIGENLWHL
jgi:hypothetical protein